METPARRRSGGRLRTVLIAVIVMLVIALGALAYYFTNALKPAGVPVQAQDDTSMVWIRSMYGFGPAADEQLLSPSSVAIAPNGDVYANDPQRSRIMRFSADGAFKQLIHTGAGGTGPGQFQRPGSIDVDDAGDLYVADSTAGKIIVFDDRGKYLREWKVDSPRGIDVEGDTVYVLGNGTVSAFTKTGGLDGSFGSRGRARGEIDAFQGIVGNGNTIYVADALNARVEAFNTKGEVLWVNPDRSPKEIAKPRYTEKPKTSDAPFDLPQDGVIDGKGRLVLVDAFKFQIIVLDPKTGAVAQTYGDYGTGDGKFFYPTGIDYDPGRDWFAIADTRNNRVQIVRLPGSGATEQTAVARVVTSPYRYCAAPILLAALGLGVGLITRPRRRRVRVERPQKAA